MCFVSGLSVTTGSVSWEQHQLRFREADKGSGDNLAMQKHAGAE